MEKNKNIELEEKGLKAAKMYLSRRGLEILNEEPFECEHGRIEIIARSDERGLVFASVATTRREEGFATVGKADREKLERVAMAFLSDYEEVDIPISFDEVAITEIGEDRAMLRWHQNILV